MKWVNESLRQDQSDPPWPSGTVVTAEVLAEYKAQGWLEQPIEYKLPRLLTLEQAAAWEQVKAQRLARDKLPLSYLSASFDFESAEDREKIKWMIDAAKRATEKGLSFSVDWTMADNSVLTLTADQVLDIPLVVAARSDATHQKARAIKARIDAAGNPEAIDAILADADLWEVQCE